MSVEAVNELTFESQRPYTYRDDDQEDSQASYVLPILPWDEIAQKWPEVRFSSFFPAY